MRASRTVRMLAKTGLRFDPIVKAPAVVVFANGKSCYSTTANCCVRAGKGDRSGKKYFAIRMTGSASNAGVGIANESRAMVNGNYLGISSNEIGYVFANNGDVYFNNSAVANYDSFSTGGLIEVAIDIDGALIWFRSDSGNWNGSGTANPTTGTEGLSISGLAGAVRYPAVNPGQAAGAMMTITPTGVPPSGFSWFES